MNNLSRRVSDLPIFEVESQLKEDLTEQSPVSKVSVSKEVPLDSRTTPRILAILAVVSSLMALTLISLACYLYNRGLYPQPTLSRHHYSINIAGYSSFLHGVVSFRIYSLSPSRMSMIHIGSHLCGVCLITTGITIKAIAKTVYPLPNGTYEYNLFTLHSMIAMASIILLILQIFGAKYVLRYLRERWNLLTPALQFHRELGIFTLTALTAVVSAGIQQLFTLSGCMPLTGSTHPNPNPGSTYVAMPISCKLLNGAGVMVYVASFLSAAAVSGFSFKKVADIFDNMNA